MNSNILFPALAAVLMPFANANDETARLIRIPYADLVATGSTGVTLPDPGVLAPYVRGDAWMGLSYTVDFRLEGGGEAYLAVDDTLGTIDLIARTNQQGDLEGKLTCPTEGEPRVGIFSVKIPASAAQPADIAKFETARATHYTTLADLNLPGSAWFRHRAGTTSTGERRLRPEIGFQRGDADGELGATLDLFTGAQALAENLRLETILAPASDGELTVPVDSIAGIEVKPFDFAPLLAGKQPALDPLASFIPAGQHAVFFPSLTGLMEVIDELDRLATPLLQMLDERAVDAQSAHRIQQQLCLPLSEMGRRFGPLVLRQAAMTSSDPFLRSGTDIALLFQARDGGADLFVDYWKVNAKARGAIQEIADGLLPCSFVRTADRSTSSYLARKGDLLIVTNSKAQLDAIAAVIAGTSPALATSGDYRFFRDRYPLDGGESALVVLPDEALRRWCSPRWRIADSRRVMALARLAEERAARVEAIAMGKAEVFEEPVDPVYGSLAFATPIAELRFDQVTTREAEAYGRFRDTYQRGFRAFFDPIAISIKATGDQLDVDLSVIPLIFDSEFNDLVKFCSGSKLDKDDGRPHPEAIAQIAFAIDPKSDALHEFGQFLREGGDASVADPLAFLGDYVTVYFDEDPFLEELVNAEDPEEKLTQETWRVPFALEVAIRDPLRAGLFMTSMRMMAEQTVPGLLTFENFEHAGKKYVRVKAMRGAISEEIDFAIYYAIDPTRLLITPCEAIVKRALDGKSSDSQGREWLGANAAFRIDRRALSLLERLSHDDYTMDARLRAARAIPILNEWKRLFPNEDPVAFHERVFHERLATPECGAFTWDAARGTMTTTDLGDLAAPKAPQTPIQLLAGIQSLDLGLTFELGGVRARGRIER